MVFTVKKPLPSLRSLLLGRISSLTLLRAMQKDQAGGRGAYDDILQHRLATVLLPFLDFSPALLPTFFNLFHTTGAAIVGVAALQFLLSGSKHGDNVAEENTRLEIAVKMDAWCRFVQFFKRIGFGRFDSFTRWPHNYGPRDLVALTEGWMMSTVSALLVLS